MTSRRSTLDAASVVIPQAATLPESSHTIDTITRHGRPDAVWVDRPSLWAARRDDIGCQPCMEALGMAIALEDVDEVLGLHADIPKQHVGQGDNYAITGLLRWMAQPRWWVLQSGGAQRVAGIAAFAERTARGGGNCADSKSR